MDAYEKHRLNLMYTVCALCLFVFGIVAGYLYAVQQCMLENF